MLSYEFLFGKKKILNKRNAEHDILIKRTEYNEKFRWYGIIHTICQTLNKTDTEVYEMNYINCLNWLSYLKDKNEVEQNRREKK